MAVFSWGIFYFNHLNRSVPEIEVTQFSELTQGSESTGNIHFDNHLSDFSEEKKGDSNRVQITSRDEVINSKSDPEKGVPREKFFAVSESVRLNINAATAEELKILRGIGPVLSERIVKYRNALGGFIDVDQLFEVYGLDSSVVDDNRKSLYADGAVETISVNSCSYLELVSHPYIKSEEARAILDFVKEVRPFRNPSEIEQLNEITSDKFRKIVPYISTTVETPHRSK